MEEKLRFINEWKAGQHTFSSLCEAFGISRTLGYRLIGRYEVEKEKGLEPRSRAPLNVSNRTPTEIEKAICDLRLKYPRLGADKILSMLHEEKRFASKDLPAVSTGNLILKRCGLVKPRKRFRRVEPVHPIFDPKAPNEVWSADFKGHFRMGNGQYCYPLTIADSFSRVLFLAKGLLHPTLEGCLKGFEQTFREFGLPQQIHTDNGLPFGCVTSLGRLTRLAVWFIELGIEPVYSDPGHPEQNGRHERMHLELKGEATRPPGYNLQGQQRKLNTFVHFYNEIRPHDACGKKPPIRGHIASERLFPVKIREWEYPKEFVERRVCRNGALRWGHSHWVGVSTALAEKRVGLEEVGEGIWRVYFRQKALGYFDEKVLRIQDDQGRFKRNKV
jgi:transposase InsO family protein